MPNEISKGCFTPSNKYSWENKLNKLKGPYAQNLAKLYYAIKNPKDESVDNYKNIIKQESSYPIFATNLYPISFNNISFKLWNKHGLNKITGFDEKRILKTWCFLHRFPAISKMVKKHSPKLIIGTGISCLTDFFACCASANNSDASINVGILQKERRYYWSKLSNGTTLVVIPFFSSPRYGLNSSDLLLEMAEEIRTLVPNL